MPRGPWVSVAAMEREMLVLSLQRIGYVPEFLGRYDSSGLR